MRVQVCSRPQSRSMRSALGSGLGVRAARRDPEPRQRGRLRCRRSDLDRDQPSAAFGFLTAAMTVAAGIFLAGLLSQPARPPT